MKAIVNATPLIALSLVGRLTLLQDLFDEVIVPAAVYDEVVVQGRGRPGSDELSQADWLHVAPFELDATIEPLLLGLDSGELSVLLLAQQIQPDWVIIDERLARRVAHAMGLPVKGTLGVLLAAVWAELLSPQEAFEDLDKLVNAGIRVSPRWQNWFRSEVSKV